MTTLQITEAKVHKSKSDIFYMAIKLDNFGSPIWTLLVIRNSNRWQWKKVLQKILEPDEWFILQPDDELLESPDDCYKFSQRVAGMIVGKKVDVTIRHRMWKNKLIQAVDW